VLQVEVHAQRRGVFLQLAEQGILVRALEFNRDDEMAHAALLKPLQHQIYAALRRGNHVAHEPVDGLRRLILERIAAEEF